MHDLRAFSFVEESINNQTPDETLNVLIYEVAGDMNKRRHYMSRYPEERNAYLGDQKGEASDALSMLRMYFEQMNWDIYEMAKLGEARYLDRMNDLRRHGIQSKLRRRGDE